jgi:methyl-accepting chemotaxis protein
MLTDRTPRLSLTLKYLLPVMALLVLAMAAVAVFGGRGVRQQTEMMARDAAVTSLSFLAESIELAMAQGTRDFDPLLERLSVISRLSDPRVTPAPELRTARPHLPDAWEREVLASGRARDGYDGSGSQRAYRVVLPIVARESCRACHEDVRTGQVVATVSGRILTGDWDRSAAALRNRMILVGVITTCVLIVVARFVSSRFVMQPLGDAGALAQALAEGDVTLRVPVRGTDEMGRLAVDLNRMADRLAQTLASIRETGERVAEGSRQLADATDGLSQDVARQAAQANEAASSVDELTSSLTENAQRAARSNDLSSACAREAEAGSGAVLETVTALRRIAEQVRVIDDIARQTHLLALNATIEASHAGDAGRGFAVVALEVRRLAERSRQAASEIHALTDRSVEDAEQVGARIGRIVADVGRAGSLVQEITEASHSQALTARAVASAVGQVSGSIQRRADTFVDMAAATRMLAEQAESLRALLAQFRTS